MKLSIELDESELHDEGLTGLIQSMYKTQSKRWILDYIKSKMNAIIKSMDGQSANTDRIKSFADTLLIVCDDLDQYIDGQLRLEVEGEKIQTFKNLKN